MYSYRLITTYHVVCLSVYVKHLAILHRSFEKWGQPETWSPETEVAVSMSFVCKHETYMRRRKYLNEYEPRYATRGLVSCANDEDYDGTVWIPSISVYI